MSDRKLLLERLERLAIVLDELMPQCAELVRDAISLLKEQPEIVRCKDCKHYDNDTQSCNNGLDGIFFPDWFCADGELKEGVHE